MYKIQHNWANWLEFWCWYIVVCLYEQLNAIENIHLIPLNEKIMNFFQKEKKNEKKSVYCNYCIIKDQVDFISNGIQRRRKKN